MVERIEKILVDPGHAVGQQRLLQPSGEKKILRQFAVLADDAVAHAHLAGHVPPHLDRESRAALPVAQRRGRDLVYAAAVSPGCRVGASIRHRPGARAILETALRIARARPVQYPPHPIVHPDRLAAAVHHPRHVGQAVHHPLQELWVPVVKRKSFHIAPAFPNFYPAYIRYFSAASISLSSSAIRCVSS